MITRARGENLLHEMRIGFRLQPLLYPRCRASVESRHVFGFSYVFFSKSPVQRRTFQQRMGTGLRGLELFGHSVKGVFIPCSNEALELLGIERAEPCQFCEYASLCRRFERQAPARMARFLQQLLPERRDKFESGPNYYGRHGLSGRSGPAPFRLSTSSTKSMSSIVVVPIKK
jgi:hypothetical protein